MSTLYSKAKIGGHPIHPMLVAFPVTFYTTTLIAFAVYAGTGSPFWWRVGLWSNVAGVVTALLAAIPGLIDWAVGIPRDTNTKMTGLWHMLINVAALLLFAINLFVHRERWALVERTARFALENGAATVTTQGVVMLPDPKPALILTGIGFLLTLAGGFLGSALVQIHHVGVDLTDEQKRIDPSVTTPHRPRPIVQG